MLAIDTNVVVRYLTGDHPEQSPRARVLIDGQQVFVARTVMHEVDWVLRSVYGFSSLDTAKAIRAFAGLPTVTVEDGSVIAEALGLVDDGLDFADALHLCGSLHCEGFATFDRKLVRSARKIGRTFVREA